MASTTPTKEKTFQSDQEQKLPKSFIMRRLHSILGLWLVIYLAEHLLVNSQAAFYFQDHGETYVRMVNTLEDLPYLPVIEIIFLGLPFLIHGIWGIFYLRQAKHNAHKDKSNAPSLPQFKRNRAYSWERWTAWILIPLILFHVFQMRFWAVPKAAYRGLESAYMVKLKDDAGLKRVAEKLGGTIFDSTALQAYQPRSEEQRDFFEDARKKKLGDQEVLALTPTPGAAFFLMTRDTFKSPLMVILYSIFVLAACYHAFNGLWTFMITWGITLTRRSQSVMRKITHTLMLITSLLGLVAIWGVYWTIQFQT